jgi:hypothetical protein
MILVGKICPADAGRHPSEAHRIVLFDMDTDLRRSDVLPANWMCFPTEII